jgi:hypothetical protein
VLVVVRDLIAVHNYLGDLKRLTAWSRARWASIRAVVRRLLRRPGRGVVVRAGAASAVGIAGSVTVRMTPGPFVPQPSRSLPEQLASQAEYLNRLRDWMMREVQQRDEAIEAERERARAELQAERERLEGVIEAGRQEVHRLRELTTSGTGSRWLGVPCPADGGRLVDLAGWLGRSVAGLAVGDCPWVPRHLLRGCLGVLGDRRAAPGGQREFVAGPLGLPSWSRAGPGRVLDGVLKLAAHRGGW